MDISSIVITAAFVLYGWTEYRRREKAYLETLDHLMRGEIPPATPQKVEAWRLVTTAAVTVILFSFVGTLLLMSLKGRIWDNLPILAMVVALLVPLVLLILIFIRDFRLFHESPRIPRA